MPASLFHEIGPVVNVDNMHSVGPNAALGLLMEGTCLRAESADLYDTMQFFLGVGFESVVELAPFNSQTSAQRFAVMTQEGNWYLAVAATHPNEPGIEYGLSDRVYRTLEALKWKEC